MNFFIAFIFWALCVSTRVIIHGLVDVIIGLANY